MITFAVLEDLQEIDDLAVVVINDMASSKIPQWELDYPRYEHYKQDVLREVANIDHCQKKIAIWQKRIDVSEKAITDHTAFVERAKQENKRGGIGK